MQKKSNAIVHRVATYRDAGLEARWSKTSRGTPIIVVRNRAATARHQRETWWMVDRTMFDAMKSYGVIEGFEQCTILGDIFSIQP